MEQFISLKEAAGILGVSHEAVRRLCHRGTLRHRRWSGRMLVRRSDVEARLDEIKRRGRAA